LSPLFGVDAGAGAGVDGVEGLAVLLVESLVFAASLLSEGLLSLEASEEPSELFGA